MIQKIDPVLLLMVILFACILGTLCYMSKLEREDKNKRAELIKEAIENNWTPEQVKLILDSK